MNSQIPPSTNDQNNACLTSTATPKNDITTPVTNVHLEGPLPAIINAEDKSMTCPYCRAVIANSSIISNPDKTVHSDCGKEFVIPQEALPAILSSMVNSVVSVMEGQNEKAETISEAVIKSIKDRIQRITRKKKVTPEQTNNDIKIGRKGDTNSKRTSRGRANFRGIRKKRMDRKRLQKLDKYYEWGKKGFPESTMYIMGCYKGDRQTIIECFNLCDNIHSICEHLDQLEGKNIDQDWLKTAKQVASNLAESRINTTMATMARLGDWESESAAITEATSLVNKYRKYYPNLWIEHQEHPKSNASIYLLVNDSGNRLSKAKASGMAILVS